MKAGGGHLLYFECMKHGLHTPKNGFLGHVAAGRITQAKAMVDEFAALPLRVLVELGFAGFGRP